MKRGNVGLYNNKVLCFRGKASFVFMLELFCKETVKLKLFCIKIITYSLHKLILQTVITLFLTMISYNIYSKPLV